MNRRAILQAAIAASVGRIAYAQVNPRPKVLGVGFYRIPAKDLEGPRPAFPGARTLVESLEKLGWVVGKNLQILWRSAEGRNDRVPAMIGELVAQRVDVIAVSGNNLIEPAKKLTRTIPIVMMQSYGPVESGFVAPLPRPGGNVTGLLSETGSDLQAKRCTAMGTLLKSTPRR